MLRKALMTGMAVAAFAAGALALQPSPAEAGNFSVQLHFGSPGFHAGPRFGHPWYSDSRYRYRDRCYTEMRPVTIRYRYGVRRTIWEPVRVCRW